MKNELNFLFCWFFLIGRLLIVLLLSHVYLRDPKVPINQEEILRFHVTFACRFLAFKIFFGYFMYSRGMFVYFQWTVKEILMIHAIF